MIIFTYIGIAVASLAAPIVLIFLYHFLQEAFVGIRVVLWLNSEWNEMIRQGLTEQAPNLRRLRDSVKFFLRTFGSFRNTRFNSKLNNIFN